MLTEDTVNAFMIIESVSGQESDKLNAALDELAGLIEKELGGEVKNRSLTGTIRRQICCRPADSFFN